jgi:hypothetical protein
MGYVDIDSYRKLIKWSDLTVASNVITVLYVYKKIGRFIQKLKGDSVAMPQAYIFLKKRKQAKYVQNFTNPQQRFG